MIGRFERYLPLVVLAATLAALFFPVVMGQALYWGLPTLQFHPWRLYAVDQLAAGTIPWWNPYNGAGAPLLANYQSALLYPPNWLTLVLPVPWSMSLLAVAHLFIAGWGMWLFVGQLGVGSAGRAAAALAFGLTQYTLARSGTYPIVLTVAWTGWVLWAADATLRTTSLRAPAALALFTALLLLAGHAQSAWYILLLTAALAIWRIAIERAAAWKRLLPFTAALLLGGGMAALQLFATGELLLMSQRGDGVDFDFAMNFSYAPLRTLNLIAPNLFGTPADGSYITNGAYFEDAVYVGMLPLISALALLRSPRRLTRGAGLWALVILIGFVFALGRYTPIFPFFYQVVPTFDLFQAPVRWHLWTVTGLSVLAAFGVERWSSSSRLRRWSKRGLAIAAALLLVGVIASGTGGGAVAVLGRGLITPSLMLGAVGTLLLFVPTSGAAPRQRRRWLIAVCIVTAVDLALASHGLNPTVDPQFFLPRSDGAATMRSYLDAATVTEQTYERFFRFQDYRIPDDELLLLRASRLPNINLLDRAPLLNQFDPLLVDHYAQFIDLVETADVERVRPGLLAAAGVNGHPRAWMVGSVCWHMDESAVIAALSEPDFDPDRQAHLLGTGPCPADVDPLTAQIRILHEDGDSLDVSISAPQEGWLVVADTDYPGWKAYVNERPTPIQRANLAFRAVPVPAGASTVRFVYEPDWFIPSLIITGLSWSIWSVMTGAALIAHRAGRAKSH
ncbi:MAG: YfhO family protein [Candidatus Flexifilum sp.]